MWQIRHGSWWMLQWQFDGWFSLGLHIDFKRRVHGRYFVPYGPYLDLHIGPCILSVGRNCYLATDGINAGRGGVG